MPVRNLFAGDAWKAKRTNRNEMSLDSSRASGSRPAKHSGSWHAPACRDNGARSSYTFMVQARIKLKSDGPLGSGLLRFGAKSPLKGWRWLRRQRTRSAEVLKPTESASPVWILVRTGQSFWWEKVSQANENVSSSSFGDKHQQRQRRPEQQPTPE